MSNRFRPVGNRSTIAACARCGNVDWIVPTTFSFVGCVFVALEDETGAMNLVIRPDVWLRHAKFARRSNAWLVSGVLESRERIIHILVGNVEDLTKLIGRPISQSRDFH